MVSFVLRVSWEDCLRHTLWTYSVCLNPSDHEGMGRGRQPVKKSAKVRETGPEWGRQAFIKPALLTYSCSIPDKMNNYGLFSTAFPVCAADAGGASCWRETETCGDSSCPGWGHSQQQPPPGPGELSDSCTVWSPSGKTTLEYRGGEKTEINNCRYLVDLSIFIPGSKLEEPLSHFLVFYFSLLSAAELCLPARACAAGTEALHGCRAEGPQTHIETLPAYCGGWPPEGRADEIPGVCVRACEVFGWGEHTPVLCTRESLVCWPWNTQKTENSTMWGSYKSSFHSTRKQSQSFLTPKDLQSGSTFHFNSVITFKNEQVIIMLLHTVNSGCIWLKLRLIFLL